MAQEKRVIAIHVSPSAYDEIQKLRGKRTWTRWAIEMALLEHPDNETLKTELASQPTKESKVEEKPKTKKVKKEG